MLGLYIADIRNFVAHLNKLSLLCIPLKCIFFYSKTIHVCKIQNKIL